MLIRFAWGANSEIRMKTQVLPDGEIFIVDDDPMVRDMLSDLFTLEGYQVESFAEGSSFLAAARARNPA